MPGIVGLLTQMPREAAEVQLREMVGALSREPFYRVGTWIDERLGVSSACPRDEPLSAGYRRALSR